MMMASGWFRIGIVWLCFGISLTSLTCGKFEFKNNIGRCRPCRKCQENIDEALRQGKQVDSCMKTAQPKPDWLEGVYWCQGIRDPVPECKKWSPQNGRLQCTNDMKIATNCKLYCNKDYYLSSDEYVRCTGDLEWSKVLPYCVHVNDSITTTPRPECLEWLPVNGDVNCTDGRRAGSTCTLSCNKRFIPSTNQPVNCSKQLQWDRDLPVCIPEPTTTTAKPTCELLVVTNGTLYCPEDMFSGSECFLMCNVGYTPLVNKTVTCTDDLIWSDALPSCVEIQLTTPTLKCQDLIVENGTVLCTKEFEVDSLCNVTCPEGLIATFEEALCRQDQTWSNGPLYCVSPVPEESVSKITDETFPSYIVVIIVVLTLISVVLIIVVILVITKLRRSPEKKSNIAQNRKHSDEIELQRLKGDEESDCESCGKVCFCLIPKKTKVDAESDQQPTKEFGNIDTKQSDQQPTSEKRSFPISMISLKCPNGRRPQLSKDSASARALKAAFNNFDDIKQLKMLFDQKSTSGKLTWHDLASKLLKMTTHEIDNLEYTNKGEDRGPTHKVFTRFIEKGITLFEVIECLENNNIQTNGEKPTNVDLALDILYKYCDQEVAT